MRSFYAMLAICLTLTVGLGGCSGGETDNAEKVLELLDKSTPGQLVEEFTAMVRDPEKRTADAQRFIIISQLAAMGPKTLSPIIDMMAAPDTSDDARLFILQCLTERLTPLYMDDLTPLLVSENHVIRACAVTLIGHIEHPDVMPLLEVARKDKSPSVSFSALSSMAVWGDQEARDELSAMYLAEDVEPAYKTEIIRVVLRGPVKKDLDILTAALNEDHVDIGTRARVAGAVGALGNASSIGPLETSLEKYPDPLFTQVASEALEAIRQREEQAPGAGQ